MINLLSQFADDTNIYLDGDHPGNLNRVTEILQRAEHNLGLKVNYEKTVLYRMGSLVNSKAKLYTQKQYAWDDPPIHTLGIIVHTNHALQAKLNLEPLYQKTLNVLSSWHSKRLTLMGCVLVVNTLVESLFVYKFSVLSELDDNIIQSIQTEILKSFGKVRNRRLASIR